MTLTHDYVHYSKTLQAITDNLTDSIGVDDDARRATELSLVAKRAIEYAYELEQRLDDAWESFAGEDN